MNYTFKAPKRLVKRVFIHCSASDRPEDDNARTINDWHHKRWGTSIGYHFYIRKDGTLEKGRNLEIVPAAQQGHNSGTIAICLGGLREEKFTQKQFDTLKELCNQIHAELPLATFHGHKEVAAKECPVFDYKTVLNLDEKGRLLA